MYSSFTTRRKYCSPKGQCRKKGLRQRHVNISSPKSSRANDDNQHRRAPCLRRRADASGLECGLAAPEFSTIEWSASASCKSAVIFPRDDAIDLGAPFRTGADARPWPTIWARKSNSSRTGAYFFGASDLTERPRRIRHFAYSIRRAVRCFCDLFERLGGFGKLHDSATMLNDQPLGISVQFVLKTKPPSGVCSPETPLPLRVRCGEIVR